MTGEQPKGDLELFCDALSSFENKIAQQANLSGEYKEPPYVAGALAIVLRISVALRVTLRELIPPDPDPPKPPAATGRRPRP